LRKHANGSFKHTLLPLDFEKHMPWLYAVITKAEELN